MDSTALSASIAYLNALKRSTMEAGSGEESACRGRSVAGERSGIDDRRGMETSTPLLLEAPFRKIDAAIFAHVDGDVLLELLDGEV